MQKSVFAASHSSSMDRLPLELTIYQLLVPKMNVLENSKIEAIAAHPHPQYSLGVRQYTQPVGKSRETCYIRLCRKNSLLEYDR